MPNNFSPLDFVVFTVSSDMDDYNKYTKKSIEDIDGLQSSVIEGNMQTNIAQQYNNFIHNTTQRFLIFAHQDVEFSNDIITIFNQIYDENTIGAVGIIGRGFDSITYFGGVRYGNSKIKNVKTSKEVCCLDSCLCIIDREHKQLFDEILFNGLHCFVEDYCCNQLFLKRKVLVIEIEKVEHWGTTTAKLGSSWGNYSMYRQRLQNKWYRFFNVYTT